MSIRIFTNERDRILVVLYNNNFQIVDGKSELVHYIDRLTKILDKTLHMKSTEANKMSATLLQVIVFSLSFTQPREYRSVSESLDSDVKDFLPIR